MEEDFYLVEFNVSYLGRILQHGLSRIENSTFQNKSVQRNFLLIYSKQNASKYDEVIVLLLGMVNVFSHLNVGSWCCARYYFISSELILHIYNSIFHPCVEHCCHMWSGALGIIYRDSGQHPKTVL